MPTSKDYRLQAKDCLKLANRPNELYLKEALLELVAEFNDAADELERSKLYASPKGLSPSSPQIRRVT